MSTWEKLGLVVFLAGLVLYATSSKEYQLLAAIGAAFGAYIFVIAELPSAQDRNAKVTITTHGHQESEVEDN